MKRYLKCSACQEEFPEDQFHIRTNRARGRKSSCKPCTLKKCRQYIASTKGKKVQKQYQKSENGRLASHKTYKRGVENGQQVAYTAVRDAVSAGEITKPKECERCRAGGRVEGHHHKGYARKNFLNVQWLCPQCHQDAHRIMETCENEIAI